MCKNKIVAHEAQPSVSLMFALISSVICYFTDSQQHEVYLIYVTKKQNFVNVDVIYESVLQ